MSYVNDNLRPNEQVIVTAKVNIIAFVTSIVIALVIIIVCASMWGGLGALLGIIVAAVYVAISYLKMKSIELGITNKKVVGKVGIIRTASLDAYLDKIDNISISQDFWGKILGYSTIQVNTTSAKLYFTGITNAEEVKHAAMDQIELYAAEKSRYQAQAIADALAAKMR